MKIASSLLLAGLLTAFQVQAQLISSDWLPVSEQQILTAGIRQIIPKKHITVAISPELKNKLMTAPHERNKLINQSSCIISLPVPDGSFQRFRVVNSPVMADELASSF